MKANIWHLYATVVWDTITAWKIIAKSFEDDYTAALLQLFVYILMRIFLLTITFTSHRFFEDILLFFPDLWAWQNTQAQLNSLLQWWEMFLLIHSYHERFMRIDSFLQQKFPWGGKGVEVTHIYRLHLHVDVDAVITRQKSSTQIYHTIIWHCCGCNLHLHVLCTFVMGSNKK